MKRYLVSLMVLTLVLVAAGFVLLWWAPALYHVVFSLVPLYFAVVTGVQHHLVTRAAHKDARLFVRTFLGLTVASLFLHIVVLAAYMFTHIDHARPFALVFAIGYIAYLVFETASLLAFFRRYQREHQQPKANA